MRNKWIMAFILCFIMVMGKSGLVTMAQTITTADDLKRNNRIVEYFENKGNVNVIGREGEDITEKFFDDNLSNYYKKNYSAIKDYIYDNVDRIKYAIEENGDENSMMPLADRNGTVTERVEKILRPNILNNFTLIYHISGTYRYNPNTGKITSVGSTRIHDIDYEDKAFGVYAKAYDITADAGKIIDSGYTAYFSGSLKVMISSEPDYSVISEYFGPFSAVAKGHAQ